MRTITRIILHCSASVAGVNLSGNDIKCMHCNPVRLGGRGWRNPGYHYVVRLDGTIDQILDVTHVANGVKGYNQESVHICYVGGLMKKEQGKGESEKSLPAKLVPANTMTSKQRAAIVALLLDLHKKFPQAKLYGHNQLAAKACPSFKVKEEFPEMSEWCAAD